MIKLLDKQTIEKIAAGEVIESPVSVVKELVENSIDAKSNSIVVEIRDGGKSYIRVTDNGVGIPQEEVEKAFLRHSTSKISQFSDLYSSKTMGFRGEALASIITCMDVEIISSTASQKSGVKLNYLNGQLVDRKKIATNVGCSIICRNLFKNIPVRRKFLKTDNTEANKITKLMYVFAFGNPYINIKYIKDNRIIFDTKKDFTLKDNLADILDKELSEHLIKVDWKDSDFKLYGYISDFNYFRGNRNHQYFYVNGRYVTNENVIKAIEDKYRGNIPDFRFPCFILFLEMNPKNIDVNIRPDKKKVKFSYEEEVLNFLAEGIENYLDFLSGIKKIEPTKKNQNTNVFTDDFSKLLNKINPQNNYEKKKDTDEGIIDQILVKDGEVNYNRKLIYTGNKAIEKESRIDLENSKNHIFKEYIYKTSIFNKYSIFENNEKVLILSHRKAELNIKFTQYKQQINNHKTTRQLLLQPMTIDLAEYEIVTIDSKIQLLKDFGYDVEFFGEKTLLVREVPAVLSQTEANELLYILLDSKGLGEKFLYERIYKLLKSNSFKKGDRINESEATLLLEKLSGLDNPYKTYDGKNCIVLLTAENLEKYFDK